MKTLKTLALAAALFALAASPACAQFDYFGQQSTIQFVASTAMNFTNVGTATLSSLTTNVIDVHGFDGIGKIDFIVVSNKCDAALQATLTNTIQSSTYLSSNWATVTTAAYGVPTTVAYTNLIFGDTNCVASDYYILPGTITANSPAVSGWASPFNNQTYLVPAPFTNTAVIGMSASKVYQVGLNLNDSPRYLQVISDLKGSNVTYTIQAVLTGRRASNRPW
jgi:hypothetical protein